MQAAFQSSTHKHGGFSLWVLKLCLELNDIAWICGIHVSFDTKTFYYNVKLFLIVLAASSIALLVQDYHIYSEFLHMNWRL